jgi:FkbM family methyltransferase
MKGRIHKTIGRVIRRKLRMSVLSRHGIGVLAETKNGFLVVEPGDFALGRQLLQHGEYDYRDVAWLSECVGHDAERIVVVGAHIGSILIPLSRVCREIIGYEADIGNFRLLDINVRLNEVSNARLRQIAVTDQPKAVRFRRNPLNTGGSSVVLRGNKGLEVEGSTLDLLLGRAHVDLLIIDAEGHELHVLKGATCCLNNTRLLYIEFAPEQLAEHRSDPIAMLDLLFEFFPLMYVLGKTAVEYGPAAAKQKLESEMHRRGYLMNLLFSRSRLGESALGERFSSL